MKRPWRSPHGGDLSNWSSVFVLQDIFRQAGLKRFCLSPGFIPRIGKQNGRFCCLPTILQKSPFGSFSKAPPQPFIHNAANLSGHVHNDRSPFPACCFNFPMASLILQTSTVRTLICSVTPKWWTFQSTLDCTPYAGAPGKLSIDARHKGHLRSEFVKL